MFFGRKKCKHAFDSLVVLKDSTIKHEEDCKIVVHHFHCLDCGENVDIRYAKFNECINEWFKRKEEYVV
jgi:Fe2+ or Zn2+ uptake regulation protein